MAVAGGLATVGGGTQLATLYTVGLTIPAGGGPTVGIGGLTQGGGLGILGRKHGLACDNLVAAEVVLADGSVVACDEHRHPDLFWALRGAGGGQLGVVTSLVFKTLRAPDATIFRVTWPDHQAARLIGAWQDWAPDAPDEVDATLKLAAGDKPEVVGVVLGGGADPDALLAEFADRVGAAPISTVRRRLGFRAAQRALLGSGSTADPLNLELSKSEFFRRALPAEAIEELLETLVRDRRPGQARALHFTAWGGAYNRTPADATAFAHRRERFLLEHVLTMDPHAPAAARWWANASWAVTHPWASGRVYPNFPDLDLTHWPSAYHAENLQRLVQVKRRYDPDGTFGHTQSLSAVATMPRNVPATAPNSSAATRDCCMLVLYAGDQDAGLLHARAEASP